MPKFDEFHKHEVLDRAHVVSETWDNYILEHPVVQVDEALLTQAATASQAMHDFYQLAGSKFL